MEKINVIFFGSTSDSVIVLQKLVTCHLSLVTLRISAVVTQPPRPIGRKQAIASTPTELWAKDHSISSLFFSNDEKNPMLYASEQTVIDTLAPFQADLLVSVSYGQKIPAKTIADARFGGLNVHPSLLPRFRGADPVPWTILSGDHQAGVTIVTLSPEFDQGKIIAQKKMPLGQHEETDPLRAKLFTIGAELLADSLEDYLSGKLKGTSQNNATATYTRRLTREDGFIPWDALQKAMAGNDILAKKRSPMLSLDLSHISLVITKARRALAPWPGIWTEIETRDRQQGAGQTKKRLKILSCHVADVTNELVLDTVQLEGKNPVPYEQFKTAYLGGLDS